jgi:hypothetical protein
VKISIVIAVLDSHEVVRRQLAWFRHMPLPDDCELILVDDKSDPPLHTVACDMPRFVLLTHHENQAAWTQPAARNKGCRAASGEWLICTDIDHIITDELLDTVRHSTHDFIKFKREVAILDEAGRLVQTEQAVLDYGFESHRLRSGGFHITPHTNSFAIKRDLYWECGGVSEMHCGSGQHPNREELPLRRRIRQRYRDGKITMLTEETGDQDDRPTIYMIPNGRYCGDKDYNPFGLFHTLKRKTRTA